MLSEKTSNKIHSLYKKYLYDISLFSKQDLKLLMNYFSEHSLFNNMLKTKGYTVFKKILINIKLKPCERFDSLVKFDSNKNIFNILLFGNIKKRNLFKGVPKETLKKNSGKYLYCVYHCLSDCLFAEIDRHVYMKYLVSSASELYDKFMEKISKFSFFDNLGNYQYNTLFLKYDERKYGPNEIIYEEGDNVDGIYLILKGKCLILKKRKNSLNLSLDNINNKSLFNLNNYLTISNNDMNDKQHKNNNDNQFCPLFAKNHKNNNALLTMSVGDIFGDLETNLNINKREFTVKSVNFNKTKVWFFPLDIIQNIIINFKDLSEQKYDIIKTRYQYANIIDKVKKENPINKNEIKLEELINNNNKSTISNFKSYQQKVNIFSLQNNFNDMQKEKQYNNKNLLNNKYLISPRNPILNGRFKPFINYNSKSQSKSQLKILPYDSHSKKNIISIIKENNYIKKVNSNILSITSIETPKITKTNYMNPLDQKIFLKKINKKNAKALLKCSNNETF